MNNLKEIFVFVIMFLFIIQYSFSQELTTKWNKLVGGSDYDQSYSFCQTNDGGYIMTGVSWSNIDSTNHGVSDILVTKVDDQGNIIWKKSYGGSQNENGKAIIKVGKSNNFLIVGSSKSDNEDVNENKGGKDVWIIKINENGNILWQKNYGGSMDDEAFDIKEVSDGFIIVGNSSSKDGDISKNNGVADFLILKIDSIGNLLWEKTYGGTNPDKAYSIETTKNGKIMVSGYTNSKNGDVSYNRHHVDVWVICLTENGDMIWEKTYGGEVEECGYKIIRTMDQRFMIIGHTTSKTGDISNTKDSTIFGTHGFGDVWLLKIDSIGNLLWEKTYGGTDYDAGRYVQETPDSGFVLTGYTYSKDKDFVGSNGDKDAFLMKISKSGDIEWNKMLGAKGRDGSEKVIILNGKTYIIGGYSNSNDSDKFKTKGSYDYWITKIGPKDSTISQTDSIKQIEQEENLEDTERDEEIEINEEETIEEVEELIDETIEEDSNYTTITSSMRQNTENIVSTYPNPITSYLTVENKYDKQIQYQLYNSVGIVIKTGLLEKKSKIDMENLKSGAYYIRFFLEDKIITQKVIKL